MSPIERSGGSGGGGTQVVTLICDSLLAGSQATFDTNTILGGNIPQTAKHLDAIIYGRSDAVDTNEPVLWNFNNDFGAGNYELITSSFSGTGVNSFNGGPDSKLTMGNIPAANAPASYFSHFHANIANYAASTAFKSAVGTGVLIRATTSANCFAFFQGGLWLNAAAITRITLAPTVGNFVAGSRFTLYGLG